MQAEALLKVKDSGNFVVIKGNKADANADFLRAGMVEAGLPPAGESTRHAQERRRELHRQLGSEERPDVDGAVPDGQRQQDRHRLRRERRHGRRRHRGADGPGPRGQGPGLRPGRRQAAALNRVALGTQTVDVWKDARLLGKAAGEAAAQLCKDPNIKNVKSTLAPTIQFQSPGGNDMTSIFLTPQAITKDNLNVVLDAGWITKDDLCKDVPAGTVSVCG